MTVLATPTRRSATAPFHRLRVAGVDRLCDDAAAVTFDVPPELADDFAFRPGESLTLRRTVGGREERRTYSICAPVGSAPRIGVREVPDGLFSRWLVHRVRAGDEIEVQPPSGSFVADPEAGGRHVLVAAGSGITPVVSIASSLLERSDARVTVLYGNRRSSTVMFAEELADLKDAHGPRFDLVHVLSREPREVDLFSGRLDDDRLDRLLDALVPVADVDAFWLCGPLAMVESARALLRERGVPADRVRSELFYVGAEPPPPSRHDEPVVAGATTTVVITLDGRTSELVLPRDVPLLDAAQRTRSDLPFACKGGVCGTCRARVIEGKADMRRNYALEEAEVAAGFILTCQSHPRGERLALDFDA